MRSRSDVHRTQARGRTIVFLSLVFSLTLGLPVAAVQPPSLTGGSASGYEVDRRVPSDRLALPSHDPATAESALLASQAWRRFRADNPGWTARWSPALGAPTRLEGPPASVDGYASVTAGNAEPACRAYIAQQLSAWIPSEDLVAVRTVEAGRGYWVHFAQHHAGVPVWGGRVTVRIADHGTVQAVTNRTGRIAGLATLPGISGDASIDAARADLPGSPSPAAGPDLMILPIARDGGTVYRLTWKSEFLTIDPPGRWICFVDAANGELLWRFNDVRHGAVSGRIGALVEPVTADDAFEDLPLPHLYVSIMNPDTSFVVGVTDPQGIYAIDATTDAGRTLRAGLAGPYGFVVDANDQTTPMAAVPVPDGDPATADLTFDDSVAEPGERDVFYHAMVAHDFIKTIEPSYDLLDYQMRILVNIDQRCNAFWDGFGVNFFAAGGPCPNTARIADVVYHEYGHGITDLMYRPFAASPAMAEGFSDYYAATITGNPIIGVGFSGPGSYLRRIDVDHVYPDDWVGESHEDGLIIGSALWDLRETLGAQQADELWHFARYGWSDNYDDYFADMLAYDDDNGNVYDGTPNLTAVANIFRAHGIGDYSIHVDHAAHPDTEDETTPLALRASFLSVYALSEDQIVAHIEITRGDETTTSDPVMVATGGIREFETVLAAQPAGTTIRYYFTAADTAGTTVTYPAGGAADPIQFFIGADVTPPAIAHDALPDQPADAPHYRVLAVITDNLDHGIAPPSLSYRRNGGETTQADMPALPADLYEAPIPAGGSVGDLIEYAITARDSASVPNTITDPISGWHAFHLVRGYLRDFEANDGGFAPTGEWEWGAPSYPVTAYSGASVWGTNLDGAYSNDTYATLSLPPIDLTGYASAALVLQHWLACEPEYDGGIVEASTDGGTNWQLLIPDGDYDMGIIALGGVPGYSGGSAAWIPAQFDLHELVGSPDVRIRFTFVSDVGVTGPGWYLDDVAVVERQILGTPIRLVARPGDTRVDLTWQPPAGSGAIGNGPVTGFHVYRAVAGGGDLVRLTDSPITQASYTDVAVSNGTSYWYSVSALYGAGEGPLSRATMAMPFRPAFEAEYASLTATVLASAGVDTTLAISNAGSGVMETDIFQAHGDQSIDDVRMRIELDPTGARSPARGPVRESTAASLGIADLRPAFERIPKSTLFRGSDPSLARSSRFHEGEWDTLAVDSNDPLESPIDFSAFLVDRTADSLMIRIATHEPCGDPLHDFSLVIPFNTDGNLSTGIMSGEYAIISGPMMMAFYGVPVLILDPDLNPVAMPSYAGLDTGSTQIEFGLAKESIGSPRSATSVSAGLNADLSTSIDLVPDQPILPWLEVPWAHLSILAGEPQPLAIRLASDSTMAGIYEAKLLFETSDPDRPLVEFPIEFHVEPLVPIALGPLTARPTEEGVDLQWEVPSLSEDVGFLIYRRETSPEPGDEVLLFEEPIRANGSRFLRHVDRTAPPGTDLAYRLIGIGPQGDVLAERIVTVTTRPLGQPLEVWLGGGTPNPAPGDVTIRFGLPEAAAVRLEIFDAAGRIVRALETGQRQAAGYHAWSWDGKDDQGRRVPAGVYIVRLEAMGSTTTRKLIRVL